MAIYQAKGLIPSSIIGSATIDASQNNVFSFICQGSYTDKYNIKIYKVSDSSLVFTTGDISLSPVKYNDETRTYTLSSGVLTNGTQYFWTVTTYQGASSAISIPATFWANANATLTMSVPSVITAQSYTFTATYTQSNGVALSYYYFVLSDSSGELERTNFVFSGNVQNTFSGFVSGNNYSTQVFGVTEKGYEFSSPVYSFSVSYSKPNINITPTITQDCKTGIGTMTWGEVTQINGNVSGTYSYLQNYGLAENWALNLDSGSYYYATLSISSVFNTVVACKPNGITNGVRILQEGSYGNYEIGYDSSINRFYFNIGGVIGYSQIIPFPTTEFHFILNPTKAYVFINSIIYPITYI